MKEREKKPDLPHEDVTSSILKGAFAVSNRLGCGFLEKVYENAMMVGLFLNFGRPRLYYRRLTLHEHGR